MCSLFLLVINFVVFMLGICRRGNLQVVSLLLRVYDIKSMLIIGPFSELNVSLEKRWGGEE